MGLTSYFLYMFARRIPMLLVTLGGIVFAITRWKRHPRVSLITVLALALYWVEAFVFLCIRYWLPNLVVSLKLSSSGINALFVVISVLDDFAFAVVIILLVAAAFSGRKPATTTNN
jgi:uncharacterized membrane protein YoaK (UPF0700 family)